jgi:ketosteroid isomerase-like protein
MRFQVAAVLAATLTAGCQAAETAEQANARVEQESAAAKRVIDSLDAAFGSNLGSGNGEALAAAYTEDARVLPPGAPAVVGRAAIKAFWEGFLALKPQGTITAEAVWANGPLAVERGTVKLSYTPPGATTPVTEVGKYLVHWHRVDGKWLIADDIWNLDTPPAPAGPATAK